MAGAIISLLLNTAHLRVHRMVRALGSKLCCELLPELAKLARYRAVFSPEPLISALRGCVKFLPFHRRGTAVTIPPRATGKTHGSPPPPPRHHKHITDNFPYALYTHSRSSPPPGSQIQPHGHHLFSIQSPAAAASRRNGEVNRTVCS